MYLGRRTRRIAGVAALAAAAVLAEDPSRSRDDYGCVPISKGSSHPLDTSSQGAFSSRGRNDTRRPTRPEDCELGQKEYPE
jgi:hypothetical protein